MPIIMSPIVAVGAAALSGPGFLFCGLQWLGRTIWDLLMFGCIVRPVGKVPERDSFLARRISGPGLSSSQLAQLRPSVAVLLLRAALDRISVMRWQNQMLALIRAPLSQLRSFYGMLAPAGVVGSGVGSRERELLLKQEANEKHLYRVVSDYFASWIVDCESIHRQNRQSARLCAADLHTTLLIGNLLVSKFVQETQLDARFWSEYKLVPNDISGLTKCLLRNALGPQILQPIEEADQNGFKLEVWKEIMGLFRFFFFFSFFFFRLITFRFENSSSL